MSGSTVRCPICGKPADVKYRPACSRRCSLIDLGRWLDGSYRVVGEEPVRVAGSGVASDEDLEKP